MKLANDEWTAVAAGATSVTLQNTGSAQIIITFASALPSADEMPNLPAGDPNKIEALLLRPGSEVIKFTDLDGMNVYGRAYGTSRAESVELAVFADIS